MCNIVTFILKIKCHLYSGNRPQESKGTVIRVPVSLDRSRGSARSADKWHAVYKGQKEEAVSVTVVSSCQAVDSKMSMFLYIVHLPTTA